MAEVLYYANAGMRHDLKRAHRFRDKLGVVFRGPGWTPAGVAESEATRG